VTGLTAVPGPTPFRVLIVSDADVSRGPAVQRMLRTQLRTRRVEDAIVLGSAGVEATGGAPMHPLTARALTELSVDPREHAAHRVNERRLALADLVLTATGKQRQAVIDQRSELRECTFTVAEFARLVSSLDTLPDEPHDLIAAVADARAAGRPARAGEDDLGDPSGGTFSEHERLVRRIDRAARDISRAFTACLRAPVSGVA